MHDTNAAQRALQLKTPLPVLLFGTPSKPCPCFFDFAQSGGSQGFAKRLGHVLRHVQSVLQRQQHADLRRPVRPTTGVSSIPTVCVVDTGQMQLRTAWIVPLL